jgi:hypothetical protein
LSKKVEGIALEKKGNLPYKISTYDGLLEAIRDHAVALGLHMVPHVVVQTNCTPYERSGQRGSVRMNCDAYIFTFRLYHVESGEYLEISDPSYGLDEGDKGPGKAITYATRRAWESVLMLKRGDEYDPDTRSSDGMGTVPSKQKPPVKQAAAPPDINAWPEQWKTYYDEALANVCNKKDIEDTGMEVFDWIGVMNLMKSDLKSKGCPPEIGLQIISKCTAYLLRTAMETNHAANVAASVQANWPKLVEFLGDARAKEITEKVDQYVNENRF